MAGKSIFLFGLPGTAKSLIVRRVASAFKDAKYFGQLMNKFTTPEDVFGPVSLSKLKEDKYERKIESYLPEADFVFLDEIWKSSPAILNTLLTVINEKVFRNGSQENKVPLKALVAASNETPPKGQGLEAIYDRFIMRLLVDPVENVENFKNLIVDEDVGFDADINIDEKIETKDWEDLKVLINEIKVPQNIIDIIVRIKSDIEEYNEENKEETIYISDRRWKNIMYILKTAAYFSDREEILPVDCFLISHCIWTLKENIEEVKNIVKEAIESFSQINRSEFENINAEIQTLKNDINEECIYKRNIYDTEDIGDIECSKIKIDYVSYVKDYNNRISIREQFTQDLYIPIDKINTNDTFFPLDGNGNFAKTFSCSFNGNENTVEVKINDNSGIYGFNVYNTIKNEVVKRLRIKYKKGAFKTITARTKGNYLKNCDELIDKLDNAIKVAEEDLNKQRNKIDSPFINENDRNIILKSYEDYISDFKSRRLEVEQEKIKVEQCETTAKI